MSKDVLILRNGADKEADEIAAALQQIEDRQVLANIKRLKELLAEAEDALKQHEVKPNHYSQPDSHGNAPGVIFAQTALYTDTPPVSNSDKKPGLPPLPDWNEGIDGLEKYIDSIDADMLRGESSAIIAELGDYGTERTMRGRGPDAYARRDQLKTALEMLKDKANKTGINPQSIPELRDYAAKQLGTVFSAAVAGAYFPARRLGQANKPCPC